MTGNGAQRVVDFIGRGWSYPVLLDPRGGIALASGADEIAASLRMILSTAPGERVMRPAFGCAMWDLIFASITPGTLGDMAHAVREAVERWEPRIDLETVDAQPDADAPGQVNIELIYIVKATNDRRNLVYPFYVIPREEPS